MTKIVKPLERLSPIAWESLTEDDRVIVILARNGVLSVTVSTPGDRGTISAVVRGEEILRTPIRGVDEVDTDRVISILKIHGFEVSLAEVAQ